MVYTVGTTTTVTSATLLNLQCNTKYTIWVQTRHNRTGTSVFRTVFLPARGICTCDETLHTLLLYTSLSHPAPPTPTPTEVTVQFTSTSSIRLAWQWTSSGPAPSCFNTTTVNYHPEGGGESFLQLSDPAATEATLTDLQCNTSYTITVVATAGEHRRESIAGTVLLGEGLVFLPLQGIIATYTAGSLPTIY